LINIVRLEKLINLLFNQFILSKKINENFNNKT